MKIQLIAKENTLVILIIMIVLKVSHLNTEIIIQDTEEMTMIQKIIIPGINLQSIIHQKGRNIKGIEVEVDHHHVTSIKSLIKRSRIMTKICYLKFALFLAVKSIQIHFYIYILTVIFLLIYLLKSFSPKKCTIPYQIPL